MKAKDLIEFLSAVDSEADIILQKDVAGNGYSPLSGADHDAVYVPDSPWSGMVYAIEWSADDAGMDDDAWAAIKAKPRCVVLYPVN